ncbi:MAG: twin-arginine translocation signal domain-containing protein [Proteobacteria bacterium]|nr:MAG: twin-arginine translocation signal domain-containing protein [Pseudomonadota bacterium]
MSQKKSSARRDFLKVTAATAVATESTNSSPAVIRKAWAVAPVKVGPQHV